MIHHADLWLFRHGVAADKLADRTDAEDYVRPLTRKGVVQSINAGRLLRKIAPKFDRVVMSPRVRCVQSGVLACQELKGVKPHRDKKLDGLHPHKALDHVSEGESTLLVGHGPDLNDTVAHLTGRTVDLSRGSVAHVKIRNAQPKLHRLLSPKDIAGLLR